jgi:hypothetical protein
MLIKRYRGGKVWGFGFVILGDRASLFFWKQTITVYFKGKREL